MTVNIPSVTYSFFVWEHIWNWTEVFDQKCNLNV